MTRRLPLVTALSYVAALAFASPQAMAQVPLLQCVPYARQVSGIQIYGDAHSWWQQADGRYARGNRPLPGAVMAFKPYRSMQLGHVAAVAKVIDSRRVLLNHANWSPINGRKGQIESDVLAEDVSSANDWSEVRVWYTPIGGLGTTRYPVYGFIYPQGRKPQLAPPPHVQIALDDVEDRALTRDERKAQRRADKDARKQVKLLEKQRKQYARYLKKLEQHRRQTVRAAPPAAPVLQTDPIDDLLAKLGG